VATWFAPQSEGSDSLIRPSGAAEMIGCEPDRETSRNVTRVFLEKPAATWSFLATYRKRLESVIPVITNSRGA